MCRLVLGPCLVSDVKSASRILPNFMESNEHICFLLIISAYSTSTGDLQACFKINLQSTKGFFLHLFFFKGLTNQGSDKHSWWLNIMSPLLGELWFALTKALWAWLRTRICFLFLFVSVFSAQGLDLGLERTKVFWQFPVGQGLCSQCRLLRGLRAMVIWPLGVFTERSGCWHQPRTIWGRICVWCIFQYFNLVFLKLE